MTTTYDLLLKKDLNKNIDVINNKQLYLMKLNL